MGCAHPNCWFLQNGCTHRQMCLMLNVLLEWVCNPFCKNGSIGIVMYVARDGFYKMGAGNFHDQLIPDQPQKKSSIKWQRFLRGGSNLQNGVYKMGWPNPTYPQKPGGYPFYFAHDPTHFVEETGGRMQFVGKNSLRVKFPIRAKLLDDRKIEQHFASFCIFPFKKKSRRNLM